MHRLLHHGGSALYIMFPALDNETKRIYGWVCDMLARFKPWLLVEGEKNSVVFSTRALTMIPEKTDY